MADTTDTTTVDDDAPAGDAVDDARGGDTRDDDARGGDDAPTTLDPEAARKLRSEARSLRQRLKAAEQELEQRKTADLTDTQRLEREHKTQAARIAQLEAQLRDTNVATIAARLGVKADLVDTIAPLLDWNDLEHDDTKAIERAVRELVKARPSLSANQDGHQGGSGRGTGRGEGDMNSLIRRMAGRG